MLVEVSKSIRRQVVIPTRLAVATPAIEPRLMERVLVNPLSGRLLGWRRLQDDGAWIETAGGFN